MSWPIAPRNWIIRSPDSPVFHHQLNHFPTRREWLRNSFYIWGKKGTRFNQQISLVFVQGQEWKSTVVNPRGRSIFNKKGKFETHTVLTEWPCCTAGKSPWPSDSSLGEGQSHNRNYLLPLGIQILKNLYFHHFTLIEWNLIPWGSIKWENKSVCLST